MDVKIQPLGKRVLIEPMKQEEKTAGGLFIPDSAAEKKPTQGKIVKLGKTTKAHDFKVIVGDMVYFKTYSPEEVEVDGVTYLILDEKDILAVIK